MKILFINNDGGSFARNSGGSGVNNNAGSSSNANNPTSLFQSQEWRGRSRPRMHSVSPMDRVKLKSFLERRFRSLEEAFDRVSKYLST